MDGTIKRRKNAYSCCRISYLRIATQNSIFPEPIDEKKQIIIDLTRMELKYLKFLDQFGNEYMAKIYKAYLTNDSTQKISFLSKLPGNLGDLIMKDLEVQWKRIEQTYWIDLLFRCQEKLNISVGRRKLNTFLLVSMFVVLYYHGPRLKRENLKYMENSSPRE